VGDGGFLLGAALVGRGEELALLRQALADPQVSAVVLAGAAGVGKTRLAREAVAAAQRSGEVTYWVAGSAATEAIPFGAVAHLLPNLDAGADRFAVLQAATSTLASARRRPVVAVDDAHHLDEASAALVYHLAATGTAFVVATVRTGAPAPAQVTGLWKDGLGERVEVQALARREAAALVVALLGGPVDGVTEEQLWRLSHGNAMYLRELVSGGQSGCGFELRDGLWTWPGKVCAPARMVELIAYRIDGQSASVRELVDLVAFGEPLGVAMLEAAGVDVATIEAGEHAGLVRTEVSRQDVEVRLAHPLFGEAARAKASPLRRREISRTLAQAAGFDRPEDVLRAAVWHLDGDVTVPSWVLMAAGGRALGVLDLPLGQRMAAAAVDAGGGLEAEGMLAMAFVLCGQFDHAESLLDSVLARELPDLVRAEFAGLRAWNLSHGLGRQAEAEAVLSDATAMLTEGHDVIVCQRAHLSVAGGQTGDGCAAATEVIDGPCVPRDDVMLRALISRCQSLSVRGRYADSRVDGERAESLYARIHGAGWTQSREELVSAQWVGRFYAGELEVAEAIVDHELGLKRAAGWRVGLAWWTAWKGSGSLARGAVSTALGEFRAGAALVALETHPHQRVTARILGLHQASAAAMMGEPEEAQSALERADQLSLPQIGVTDVWGGCAHAWVAVALGDIAMGVDLALAAADRARADEQFGWEIIARHQVVRYGAPDRVLDRITELSAVVDGHLAPLYAAHANALARQDGAALDAVSTGFGDLGYQLLAAESAAHAARAHDLADTGGAASRVRAHALAARCQGARTPALGLLADSADLLTGRESEIARLAAAGLGNRAIADRLVISVRTVENTLCRIYAKLGIAGRENLGLLVT
jgi:DNA-binding CsgD family transcriptional regulator